MKAIYILLGSYPKISLEFWVKGMVSGAQIDAFALLAFSHQFVGFVNKVFVCFSLFIHTFSYNTQTQTLTSSLYLYIHHQSFIYTNPILLPFPFYPFLLFLLSFPFFVNSLLPFLYSSQTSHTII